MNPHPYLRAYMAGIVVPTVVLLFLLTGFVIARFVCQVPIPIERAIIFPMGIVPSAFGVWNMFHLWLGPRRHLPIGLHGAMLPIILAPTGYLLGRTLGILTLGPEGVLYLQAFTLPYGVFAFAFAFGLVAYYLIWKYLIGFFNQVLGIA
jgi:hypothetical protein